MNVKAKKNSGAVSKQFNSDKELLHSQATYAMRLLMLHSESLYITEIKRLTKTYTALIKGNTPPRSIIKDIQTSIADSYEIASEHLARAITATNLLLKQTKTDTLPGQNLKRHLHAMQAYQMIPLSDIQETIISDLLTQAKALGVGSDEPDLNASSGTPKRM